MVCQGGHAPQEFGCLVTWWAPGPSDRSTSSGYACVSVALVLGILELRQVFIVLLYKISLSGVVEINTIPQVILKIPQSINDGVDWANYVIAHWCPGAPFPRTPRELLK